MLFNSLTFVLFVSVVLAGYWALPWWKARKTLLLIASYLFYAVWNPPFVLLLWFSTLVDWLVARKLGSVEHTHKGQRRALLMVSLIVNLGLLSAFKYGEFFLENFAALTEAIGLSWAPAAPDIVLPIGISFYTFQTLSYTIDVYRGTLQPRRGLLDFALYVTFFPQLVAGPIVRASDFLPQCETQPRWNSTQFSWGLALMIFGVFGKVILADALLAPVVDKVYLASSRATFWEAWIGTLAFSGQIFYDFAGYSTCAIGCALCLGFALPDNFRSPYASVGFSDFWRRWHISLSTWLRDYLYISLGGNRAGYVRTLVNLTATMLLGGLWHGASWRFVVWGALHGAYLVMERIARDLFRARGLSMPVWSLPLLAMLTFLLVCLTWVFFRASSFAVAWNLIQAMLWLSDGIQSGAAPLLDRVESGRALTVVALMLAGHWMLRDSSLEALWSKLPTVARAGILSCLLLCLVLNPGDDRAFLYFQF